MTRIDSRSTPDRDTASAKTLFVTGADVSGSAIPDERLAKITLDLRLVPGRTVEMAVHGSTRWSKVSTDTAASESVLTFFRR